MKKLLLPLLLLMAQPLCAAAQPNCIASEEEFFNRLQKAAADGDKSAVSALTHFPLRISKGEIKSRKELLARYDYVFNPGVLRALKAAKFDELFRRDQGSMIGDGEIWFNNFREEPCYKVITVNDDLGRR